MSLVVRYSLVGTAVIAAFVNFISCGSQMYKASLAGDHQEPLGGEANSTDPQSPEFGLHAPKGWTSLPIVYSVEQGFDKTKLLGLQAAMATWEKATGKKLFSFNTKANPSASAFPDLASSLNDAFNGHYDENTWSKTKKSTQVIATTVWSNRDQDYNYISAADIHYNSEIYFISDALTKQPVDQREIVDMQSLALHELGHLLGLAHVDPGVDDSSIMNPTLYIGVGLSTRFLSEGDVQRIQKIYGCAGTACDQAKTAKEIQLSGQTGLTQNSSEASH